MTASGATSSSALRAHELAPECGDDLHVIRVGRHGGDEVTGAADKRKGEPVDEGRYIRRDEDELMGNNGKRAHRMTGMTWVRNSRKGRDLGEGAGE